jgi:predicted transcriptional regulator
LAGCHNRAEKYDRVPDPIFEAAERLARKRKVSRSRLYADALQQLIDADAGESVTAALDAVYVDNDSTIDPLLAAAQARTLEPEEW